MDEITVDRRKSGRMAMRYLADPKVRGELRRAAVPTNAPIVACEWETSTGEVKQMIDRARAMRTSNPDHMLVVIRRGEKMYSLNATSDKIDLIGDYISSNEVHSKSCIGHVYEALLPRKEWNIADGMQTKGAAKEASIFKIGDTSFELV